MLPENDGFAAQRELGAYIRDPESAAAPAGIEPRRLKIYAELFYNNVESLLASGFPVIRRTVGDDAWHALVRAFVREHDSRTPVFTELGRELMRYIDRRAAQGRGDAPWLGELAHYEWVELALQISEARPGDVAHDPDGDLRTGLPVLSPLAWPLAYDWPVHRIGPQHLPDAPSPTLLLVHRKADGEVAFSELGPVAWHLLKQIEDDPAPSGEAHLRRLAREAQAPDADAFVARGVELLENYRRDGIVLGTRAV